jgi:aminoglycoside/choline kinase family phosphotransferase
MDRKHALLSWAQDQINDQECYVKPASSDASFRSYWRVFSKDRTYIVMDAPPEHEDCRPFILFSKKLETAGINVPVVIAHDLSQGFLLLSDLGTVQYMEVLNQNTYQHLYKDATDALHTIQQNTDLSDTPFYDENLLRSELNLFEQWFIIKHLNKQLDEKQLNTLNKSLDLLVDNALQQPQVFVHRDYHSRNLMKTKNNNPGVLDFQDAVVGPVTYDLVSLLKDCYISWDQSIVDELSDNFRKEYNHTNQTNIQSDQWQKWFDLMGIQRHLKVLGIFCRLNYRDNKANYLKDLNLTLHYVKKTCERYSELIPLLDVINEITPNMDKLCKP